MTTLADDFQVAAAAAKGVPSALCASNVRVAHLIQRAQRFVLTDAVRGATSGLITGKPSSFLEAAQFIRLPFPITWIEWTPPKGETLAEGHFPVVRGGALLREEGDVIRMFSCWRHRELGPDIAASVEKIRDPVIRRYADAAATLGVSSLEAAFDLGALHGAPTLEVNRAAPHGWFRFRCATDDVEALARQRNDKRNSIGHALRNPAELDALSRIERSIAFRVHTEANGNDTIMAAQQAGDAHVAALVRDVEDDLGPMLAVLILLNSRNCVAIDRVEPAEKLNRARVKRGVAPFIGYSTVDIKLGKADARAAASGAVDHAAVRRHIVRGHFKLRKGGVFWWRPHIRGAEDAGVIVRQGYKVNAP